MGGPLLVVPVSAVTSWGGCTTTGMVLDGTGTPDDYDRACAVAGLAGVIGVGDDGAQALVLADEPAITCYLPQHRAFLRWLAASSEAELTAEAGRVLACTSTDWQDCGSWTTDGPAVLMDSANTGTDLADGYPDGRLPDQAPVPLPVGTWNVQAVHTEADELTWVGLVRLLPTSP
jgi:Immunity protein 21